MSSKGALTQVQSTTDCVSVYHIKTEVVQVVTTMSGSNALLSKTAERISYVTADLASTYTTGFDHLSAYLLVTYSSCRRRLFQVELLVRTPVKRCWGGGGRHPSRQHTDLSHAKETWQQMRRGHFWRLIKLKKLTYFKLFRMAQKQTEGNSLA